MNVRNSAVFNNFYVRFAIFMVVKIEWWQRDFFVIDFILFLNPLDIKLRITVTNKLSSNLYWTQPSARTSAKTVTWLWCAEGTAFVQTFTQDHDHHIHAQIHTPTRTCTQNACSVIVHTSGMTLSSRCQRLENSMCVHVLFSPPVWPLEMWHGRLTVIQIGGGGGRTAACLMMSASSSCSRGD